MPTADTSTIISGQRNLKKYIACVQQEIDVWDAFFRSRKFDWMSNKQLESWLDSFRISINALEGNYVFDSGLSLDIVANSSGFPKNYHIDEVAEQWKSLQISGYNKSITKLKKAFIDQIFSARRINSPLLEEISKAYVEKTLSVSEPMHLYRFNFIEPCNAPNGRKAFLCEWSQYTIQSILVTYTMLFESADDWEADDVNMKILSQVLRNETDMLTKLDELAADIDFSNAKIFPKWIGRIIVGPLFISHLTQDKHELQDALNAMADKDEHVCASRIIYEYVLSREESSVMSIKDPNGVEHEFMQKFAVRSDGEYRERGVTYFEKFLFAPHLVMQLLDGEYRKEIGHQLIGTGE
ncbi:MAG: hypothetical protein WC823_00700 [Parcubacteria group bacterium]|jgi:hypothetical protein